MAVQDINIEEFSRLAQAIEAEVGRVIVGQKEVVRGVLICVLAGRHALEALGFDRFRARDMANIFRRHNISVTDAIIPHFKDEDRLISAAKAGRDELEQQFARDRQQFEQEHSSKGWH